MITPSLPVVQIDLVSYNLRTTLDVIERYLTAVHVEVPERDAIDNRIVDIDVLIVVWLVSIKQDIV